jgi:phenylalanyl-tRNA synthetase alpha chain
MASDYTGQVLDVLAESNGPVLTAHAFPDVDFTVIKGSLDRLGSREMITYETLEREEYFLSEEAEGIVAEGSHEAKVFEAVRKAVDGLKISDLPVRFIKQAIWVSLADTS